MADPSLPARLAELVESGMAQVLAEADRAARQQVVEVVRERLVAGYLARLQSPELNAAPETVSYLYAILAERLDMDGVIGVDERRPDLVEAAGLVAVISDVSPGLLAGLEEEELTDSGRLARLAGRHESVVEAAFGRCALLPMRFGTTLAGRGEVASLLERCHETLASELDRLIGRHEWTLKVLPVAKDEVAAGQRILAGGETGTAYLAAKAAARTDREQQREHLEKVAGDFVASVEAVAEASSELAWMPDDAVHASAHLLTAEAEPRFLGLVEAAAGPLREAGALLELNGPLPPYHFTTSELGG